MKQMKERNLSRSSKTEWREYPFVFAHRFGKLTVLSVDDKSSCDKALRQARGLPITPQFQTVHWHR